jgi:hypothetical protein
MKLFSMLAALALLSISSSFADSVACSNEQTKWCFVSYGSPATCECLTGDSCGDGLTFGEICQEETDESGQKACLCFPHNTR